MDFDAETRRIKKNVDQIMVDMGLEPAPRDKLDTRPAHSSYRMGALLRRSFRRELLEVAHYGVTFVEDRSRVDSYFVLSGPKWALDTLEECVQDWLRRRDNA